jgi:hypothetical protein
MINNIFILRASVSCFIILVLTGNTDGQNLFKQDDPACKRFLFLDSRIIESSVNSIVETGTVEKHPENPLFGEDRPWEKRFDNLYGNVIFDKEDKLFKCWYSPFIIDHSSKNMSIIQRTIPYKPPKNREMGICYAISRDGINWEKPDLNLVEYEGSRHNNIIWRGPHGTGIFKDSREIDHARLYKAIFRGLSVSFSGNGINWEPGILCEGIKVAGDTHNNAFWAPTLGKYVAITRTWGDMGREVARTESSDFIKWTREEVVLKGSDKNFQPYAMPVFYYCGIYIGLVAIHQQDRDRVWTELTWSPDTRVWHHISRGSPLIPNSDKELDYDYGCVYACANPIFLSDKILLFYGGSDWLHTSWRNGFLCLAMLRPDGFAGYVQESEESPAIVKTIPIDYEGQTIRITSDVSDNGFIKASITDIKGKKIASAGIISETVTDEPLKFNRKIKAGRIQLKFEFSNAKLYSFSFYAK